MAELCEVALGAPVAFAHHFGSCRTNQRGSGVPYCTVDFAVLYTYKSEEAEDTLVFCISIEKKSREKRRKACTHNPEDQLSSGEAKQTHIITGHRP